MARKFRFKSTVPVPETGIGVVVGLIPTLLGPLPVVTVGLLTGPGPFAPAADNGGRFHWHCPSPCHACSHGTATGSDSASMQIVPQTSSSQPCFVLGGIGAALAVPGVAGWERTVRRRPLLTWRIMSFAADVAPAAASVAARRVRWLKARRT